MLSDTCLCLAFSRGVLVRSRNWDNCDSVYCLLFSVLLLLPVTLSKWLLASVLLRLSLFGHLSEGQWAVVALGDYLSLISNYDFAFQQLDNYTGFQQQDKRDKMIIVLHSVSEWCSRCGMFSSAWVSCRTTRRASQIQQCFYLTLSPS